MSNLSHLLESVRAVALSGPEDRLAHLEVDRWIDYPRAAQVKERLEELLWTPPRNRMPCLLIYGESGMGKTMLIGRFARDHPPHYDAFRGLAVLEIVTIEMPPAPTERRIYARLMQAIGAPYRPNDRLDALESLALGLLRRLQPRIIVVDEVHHLLGGSAREQRVTLNLLKHLSNTLNCCIVALGVYDAERALRSDDQISRRFARIELPRWQESEDLRRFLNALERTLPLRERSMLADRDALNLILEAGEGVTGEMTAFVVKAAARAIRAGQERISVPLLESMLRADQLRAA